MTGQPFFFDSHIFDDDSVVGAEDLNSPEFSKTEMKNAKDKAFEEGKKSGFQESEAGIVKSALATLQKIERDMAVLFAAEDDRNKQYETDAVHLSLSIMRKLFPLYTEKHGEEELKLAIKSGLSGHITPEKVKIELQEDVLSSLEGYIKELEGSLQKQITLVPNASFQKSECRILWPDGGIICNRTVMAEKTLDIMKETLADRGISVHDEDDPPGDNSADEMSSESDKDDLAGEVQ